MNASSADIDQTPMVERTAAFSSPIVVAELFTSEGCSSCPPADALLAELAEREGVIALAFHVDYWNYLGWSDPYSQAAFSERQRAYASVLDGRVYTPELVINGTVGLVGSQRQRVESLIATAMATPAPVEIRLSARLEGDVVIANCTLTDAPEDAVLHLALVERSTHQNPSRGENRGRTLNHTNVVRVFESLPAISGYHTLALPEGLNTSNAGIVAYVQSDEVGSVLGGAISPL